MFEITREPHGALPPPRWRLMLAWEAQVPQAGEGKGLMVRGASLLGLSILALLSVMGCAGPEPAPAERRIFFCDDLRIHSIRPDGTGLCEFPGKTSTCPWPVNKGPGIWRVVYGSYRGPYYFLDAPAPGLYEGSLSGTSRRRVLGLPELPVIAGLASGGAKAVLFTPRAAENLQVVDLVTGARKNIPLPAPAQSAAVDPKGQRAAVVLEPKLKTVMLGNQAWFTEGSDLVLVDFFSGKVESLSFPSLPDPLGAEPKLESFAGSGMSAVAWYYQDTLVVSSAPGMWNLKLKAPSLGRMARTRIPGLPPADGIAVNRDTTAMAVTCGGRLFVWDLRTGDFKDITPAGLIGGAHHPVWMEP